MFPYCRAITLLTLLFSDTALAQLSDPSDELEEIVVYGQLTRFSALKSDTPIMELARSVSIISEQQIIDKGALALDDTFTYSAGVAGEAFGFATRGDWVRVRGLDVPQYQDSLQSLFGNYNNTRPHIYTLSQVEILKGPASVLFGKGSPGGLVNIISKRPQQDAAHELALEYGNHDHHQLAIDTTGAVSTNANLAYRMTGVYKKAGTQIDEIREDVRVLAPSLSWRLNDTTDITSLLNYTVTRSDSAAQFTPVVGSLLPGPNGQFIATDAYLGDKRFNKYDAETLSLTLLASHAFNSDWSTEITARYTDGSADYQQAWPSFLIPTPATKDRYVYNSDGSLFLGGAVPRTWHRVDATSEQWATDIRLRGTVYTGEVEHSLLMGVQYQQVDLQSAGYSLYALGYNFAFGDTLDADATRTWINPFDPDANGLGALPDLKQLERSYANRPSTDVEDTGVYFSNHASWGDWHLTLGLRWDRSINDTEGTVQKDREWSTSIGLLYETDIGLSPYVSYAESFDPVIGDNGVGSPLKPQLGEQVEIGLKYEPDDFPALVTLAWFDLAQTNLPNPFNPPGRFDQQAGKATIRGIELESMAKLGAVDLQFNWSRLDTESARGARLDSVPEEQLSAWFTWQPSSDTLSGLRVGAGIRYSSARWGGADTYKAPSVTLGDAMISYQWQHWNLAINLRNVQDENYYAVCPARGDCFPAARRTIVGRLTYNM